MFVNFGTLGNNILNLNEEIREWMFDKFLLASSGLFHIIAMKCNLQNSLELKIRMQVLNKWAAYFTM